MRDIIGANCQLYAAEVKYDMAFGYAAEVSTFGEENYGQGQAKANSKCVVR